MACGFQPKWSPSSRSSTAQALLLRHPFPHATAADGAVSQCRESCCRDLFSIRWLNLSSREATTEPPGQAFCEARLCAEVLTSSLEASEKLMAAKIEKLCSSGFRESQTLGWNLDQTFRKERRPRFVLAVLRQLLCTPCQVRKQEPNALRKSRT